jgi:tetraacyldisaccharide 4'-kinase
MPEKASWEARLNRIWYAGSQGYGLRPLGWLFAVIVRLRHLLYDTGVLRGTVLPVPVLVVGNISVGGTGKTPVTIYLAQRLLELGRRPGIATRGHGRSGAAPLLVEAASRAAEVGDEPLLLKRRTGVAVCVASRRVEAARRLIEEGCDVILCDDGLQHLPLCRDIEIAVIDGERGLGNRRLLPAGPLREPPSRLADVDFVVINATCGTAGAQGLGGALTMRLVGEEAVSLTGFFANRSLAGFLGRPVHAVAAIGNPGRFFSQLRAAGLEVREHAFADHHPFTAADLRFGDDLPVLMTEKDAVKCAPFADQHHWFVPVEAVFDPADAARLMQCLCALPVTGELPK